MNPLRARRRLRTRLQAARIARGLTQEQVANALDWSLSKVIRIETGGAGISSNDTKVLLTLYGVMDPEDMDRLLALARTARERPWWSVYDDIAPPGLLHLISHESVASAVNQVEALFVPGILQTEEYAYEILHFVYDRTSSPERVDALVELRNRRRDLLMSEDAPRFVFILDEAVIHRLVGNPSITRHQLLHLIDVTELPRVTVQVVPFMAGLHPGMRESFEIVQSSDATDEDIVFLEGPRGDLIGDDPAVVQSYLESFERIADISLSPSDSVRRMRQAIEKLS